MRNSLRFEIDRELYPFESRWIRLKNGSVIHYLDEGQGPVLLLLHGNPTWSFLYRNIIKGLKDRYRCIAPDYPGFGHSRAVSGFGFTAAEQAGVIAEFVETLDLENITIMMQDWGGPIGFSVALRHPQRIHGFIIGNTWAWPLMRFGQHMFSRLMGGPVGRMMAYCCNGIVRTFFTMGVVNKVDKRVLEMYLAPFSQRAKRQPTHIFPKQLRAAEAFLSDIHQRLSLLSNKPALILWGEKDFAFQESERTRFENLFPNHDTVLLADTGHFIQEDQPEKIITAINSWFKKNQHVDLKHTFIGF